MRVFRPVSLRLSSCKLDLAMFASMQQVPGHLGKSLCSLPGQDNRSKKKKAKPSRKPKGVIYEYENRVPNAAQLNRMALA